MKQNQQINCSVGSCQYNQNNAECNLQSIQVAPCQSGATGNSADESQCASYHSK